MKASIKIGCMACTCLVVLLVGSAQAAEGNIFSAAIAHAQKRCVKIFGASISREHGYATGIIVSGEGHILTAQGIFLSTSNLRIVMADGSQHQASIEKRSDSLQLALLKIPLKTPAHFSIGADTNAKQGDWALMISNTFKVADGAEALSVSRGMISGRVSLDAKRKMRDSPYTGDVLLLDCITGNPGCPGGAIVGADGRLLGLVGRVLESKTTNTRLNYAIPQDVLYSFMQGTDSKAVEEQRGEPYIGLRLLTVGGRRAPAYIDRVRRESPAAKAGLKKDDLILAVDTSMVRTCKDYQELEEQLRPGQQVALSIKRGQRIMRLVVTVGQKESP